MSAAGDTQDAGTAAHASSTPDRSRLLDVVGLAARVVLGAVLVLAGALKVTSPKASADAVHAYQVLPYDIGTYVGYALPIVEILVGLLIIVGLFTRAGAGFGTVLMVVFIAGISQAWARGISIDCGCFGGGGTVAADQTSYGLEIARDVGLAACGAWLVWRPRSLAGLDRLWYGR